MKATRVFQLTVLVLVVVSAVQVGWWLLDRHAQTHEKVRAARTAYAEQISAAQALPRCRHQPAARAAAAAADIVADGHPTLAPQVR